MSKYSPFTISPKDAEKLVKEQRFSDDNRHCFMIQISFTPVYGSSSPSQGVYKKLPRLINGIPFGAGRLSQREADIRWKYIEGSRDTHMFISVPMTKDEADETCKTLRDMLLRKAKQVFGDVTVKSNIFLSQCLYFDCEFFINDLADSVEEGLHFHD